MDNKNENTGTDLQNDQYNESVDKLTEMVRLLKEKDNNDSDIDDFFEEESVGTYDDRHDPKAVHDHAKVVAILESSREAAAICKTLLDSLCADYTSVLSSVSGTISDKNKTFKLEVNTDLIADIISFETRSGNIGSASEHYSLLMTIPFEYWCREAFSACVQYLMTDPRGNEEECKKIISVFREYSDTDLPCLAESDLEESLGHYDVSLAILEKAVASMKGAAQCALRLCEKLLRRGDYEGVLKTAVYGLKTVSLDVETSVFPQLLFFRTLAEEGILRGRGELVPNNRNLKKLISEYTTIADFHQLNEKYRSSAQMRAKMLEYVKGGEDNNG